MSAARGRQAFIVADLGFGDAGKGLVTDYLVRRHEARLVVRFNGGAQAGHNVVTDDGRHHTFSQFGSGSFVAGVRTHLSRDVVVHPTALAVEARALANSRESDVFERLSIDPECRVTTPFQQAHNRLLELARGSARHGSCGVGVGVTMADSLVHPDLVVCFRDLRKPDEDVRRRLNAQRELKLAYWQSQPLGAEQLEEFALLSNPSVVERWLVAARKVAKRVTLLDDSEALRAAGNVVFEGAQGVLLDEDYGFHPFTTYSRCTPHRARSLLAQAEFVGETRCIGVLRSYAVRHGPGPFPTESAAFSERTSEPHNELGPWQGVVRKGYFDLPLTRYALAASESIDALCVTHLDALSSFDAHQWCDRYHNVELNPLPRDLGEQEALTAKLFAARPHYASVGSRARVSPTEFCAALAEETNCPVAYAVTGPRASDVSELG